jgi:hypothetical protein
MKIEPTSTGTATYCPEDDKLRLYVGRVPRDEYEALRAEGWTSTPKQLCQFVAVWTPEREDTALSYSDGILEDEDQSPQDRAADRAERFSGYRDKRHEEATGTADKYEQGPTIHGYQSQALAERRAAQHDRIGSKAVNLWGKAEYWQTRTAGVISNALYKSEPGVRMGRIKVIEAELRGLEKKGKEATATSQGIWDIWNGLAGNGKLIIMGSCAYSLHNADIKPAGDDGKYTQAQCKIGMALMLNSNVHTVYGSDRYKLQKENEEALKSGTMTPEDAAKMWISNHPTRPEDWTPTGRWFKHYELRLAYENQMLEAQGGRAAFVEMEAGGWIGKHQIQKVNKSPATGRVVSVAVFITDNGPYGNWDVAKQRLVILNIERLKSDVYRAPTDEERAAFTASKKEAKEARKDDPKGPSLINPTLEDAERLQAVWNAANKGRRYGGSDDEESKPLLVTMAEFNAHASKHKNVEITDEGLQVSRYILDASIDKPACKVRRAYNGSVDRVVVLTDKPQKAFPISWKHDEKRKMKIRISRAGTGELPAIIRELGGKDYASGHSEMVQIALDLLNNKEEAAPEQKELAL